MTTPTTPAAETLLQKELRLFEELFTRLVDALLNRIFDLKPEKARRRMSYVIILFFISVLFTSMIGTDTYSFAKWVDQLQHLFLYIFRRSYAESVTSLGQHPFIDFSLFALRAFGDPHTLQYIPIILAPFFIAQHAAGLYLADIFELTDISVARKFVNEVALTGSDETIRITKGEISAEHRASPNVLIGGPGRVTVDLDSVALFEKPDGTPHVIGPTGKEKGGKATLEGFERFRQAIDIRDHYVELRDEDPKKSPSVKSRSLDGIPITATDVRLMFSVHRDGKKPSTEEPYPFSEKAIEKLVYSAGSKVTPFDPNPSTFQFSWINNMISLIRGKLGGFMSERNLTLYLASIGQPEFEKAKQREEALTQQERQMAPPAEDLPKGKDIKPPPEFTPRYKITNLFTQFAQEFTNNARDRGVELHWIGVGTWKTPIEFVSEKHLEAWKLSRENVGKGSEDAIKKFEAETILLNMTTLIQDVPVAAYQKALGEGERRNTMRVLLLGYRQQLIEEAELMKLNGEAVPLYLQQAIAYIDSVLGLHWVGATKPTLSDIPKPVVILDQTVGMAQIIDLPRDGKLRVGQTYHLQVDILKDLEESSIPIEIFSDKEQTIDIVILADEMNIYPEMFHEVVITRHGKSKSPEFIINPLSSGLKTIIIQYYYKSHWLAQIKYQVEVIKS